MLLRRSVQERVSLSSRHEVSLTLVLVEWQAHTPNSVVVHAIAELKCASADLFKAVASVASFGPFVVIKDGQVHFACTLDSCGFQSPTHQTISNPGPMPLPLDVEVLQFQRCRVRIDGRRPKRGQFRIANRLPAVIATSQRMPGALK